MSAQRRGSPGCKIKSEWTLMPAVKSNPRYPKPAVGREVDGNSESAKEAERAIQTHHTQDKNREFLPFHSDQGATDLIALLSVTAAPKGGESKWVSSIAIHNELLRQGRKVQYLLLISCLYLIFHSDCTLSSSSSPPPLSPSPAACLLPAPMGGESKWESSFVIHNELLRQGRKVQHLLLPKPGPLSNVSAPPPPPPPSLPRRAEILVSGRNVNPP